MRSFIRCFVIFGFLTASGLGVTGCGKRVGGDATAFASASTEVKAAWDKGLSEAKTKDYAAALTTFQELYRKPDLTSDQKKALQDASAAVSDEMYAASNKGDAKAAEAIKVLRERQRR